MKRSTNILVLPLFLSVLAFVFCLWIGLGNRFEICVTAGCTLFEDAKLAGISMWWYGAAAFTALGICSACRYPGAGFVLAWVFLFADALLLTLMIFTAPCINCLVVAGFFFLIFLCLRKADRDSGYMSFQKPAKSLLVTLWSVLFIINIGAVLKSEVSTWSLGGNEKTASVHLFYSPSCSACRQAVEALAGKVDVAYYPVAEYPQDFARIAYMVSAVKKGETVNAAFQQAQSAKPLPFMQEFTPEALLLKFRILRNKAHVYQSGSKVIPFIEYRGLPSQLTRNMRSEIARLEAEKAKLEEQVKAGRQEEAQPAPVQNPAPGVQQPATAPQTEGSTDDRLPFETPGSSVSGACYGETAPCTDDEAMPTFQAPRSRK